MQRYTDITNQLLQSIVELVSTSLDDAKEMRFVSASKTDPDWDTIVRWSYPSFRCRTREEAVEINAILQQCNYKSRVEYMDFDDRNPIWSVELPMMKFEDVPMGERIKSVMHQPLFD